MWIYGFLPKLGVKNAYFHDFEKWQGGFRNSSDQYVVVTSKHAQGMYFPRVQLLSSYLEPLSKNRFLKFLKNGHFGALFWPFLMYFGPKYVQNVILLTFCFEIGRIICFMVTGYEIDVMIPMY